MSEKKTGFKKVGATEGSLGIVTLPPADKDAQQTKQDKPQSQGK